MSDSLFFPFREFDNKELGNKDTPIKCIDLKLFITYPSLTRIYQDYILKKAFKLDGNSKKSKKITTLSSRKNQI